MAEREAGRAQKALEDYGIKIGMGDSGRGIWIAKMQSTQQPFNRVVIRDGVNAYARNGESVLGGAKRLLQHAGGRGETGPTTAPKDNQTVVEKVSTFARSMTEMRNHARLMCGPASVGAMFELVTQTQTPVHHVALGYGIGGTLDMMHDLNNDLEVARLETFGEPLNYLATYEPTMGHNNLIDPDVAARHLQQTLLVGLPV